MSSSAFDGSGDGEKKVEAGSKDEFVAASKLAQQAHAELVKARAHVAESIGLISELTRISAVFESVAEGLVDATFKASRETTRGAAPQEVLLSFVEELGDLARKAVVGAGSARRELHCLKSNLVSAAGPLQTADAAIDELEVAVKQLSQRNADANARRIEVLYAVPAGKARRASTVDDSVGGSSLLPRGARSGFKN
ncbi:MAG TPA: hypothetical protein VNO55_09170 [Polyangia bacterium]|nr:hypothetical protein [Polyangia bacterium]